MAKNKPSRNLTTAADVDAFLAALPEPTGHTLEALRRVIRSAAPEATENISYEVPTFNYRSRFLVSYAAKGNRCSFFVRNLDVMDAYREELKPFKTSGATVHFAPDRPLPEDLVTKLVKARMAQTETNRT
jgi:uncharacterized protein YdhG (YjbR/CyaY superfamily)